MDDPADVRALARPLRDATDLDPLMERIGTARIVAIGEASHGTHEYYAWRAALTRRLVTERGFGLVAVEGDWPDCYRVNRSVKLRPGADVDPRDALDAFSRWPTWMWASDDVVVGPHPGRPAVEGVEGVARVLVGAGAQPHAAVDPVAVGPVALHRHDGEAALLDQPTGERRPPGVVLVGAVAGLADGHDACIADPLQQRVEVGRVAQRQGQVADALHGTTPRRPVRPSSRGRRT